MTTVQIKEVTDNLICKYRGQCQMQPAYIELDCRTGLMIADYNSEIGNAIPFSVWHGHDQRFGIDPTLTEDSVNRLMGEIEGFAQQVLDGYDQHWDGNNWVAKFSEEAEQAIESISEIVADYQGESYFVVEYWDDWFANGFHDELYSMRKFETGEEWSESAIDYAKNHNAIIESIESPIDWAVERACGEIGRSISLNDLERTIFYFPEWLRNMDRVIETEKEDRKNWSKEEN